MQHPVQTVPRDAHPHHRAQSCDDATRAQQKLVHDAKVSGARLGMYKGITPLGQVFNHVGTFTPMTEMKMPEMTRPGRLGPWSTSSSSTSSPSDLPIRSGFIKR